MALAGLQTSWGLVVTHLVSLGCVLLAFALTMLASMFENLKQLFLLADMSRRGVGTYLGAVNGIGQRCAQWQG